MLNSLRHILAYVAIVLAICRFCIGDILRYDTSRLTIVIALVVLLSIDYRHFRFKHYLIGAIGIILSALNPAILPTLLLFLICVSARDLSTRKIAIVSVIMQLFFLYYVFYKIGMGEIMVNKVVYEKATTYDFGFGNSNTFAMFTYSVFLCAYVAFWRKLSFCFLFLFILFSCIVFTYAYGRTVFFAELFFLLFILIAEFGGRHILNKGKYLLALFPIIIFVVFLFIIFNFYNYVLLNELLTGRIIFWVENVATYIERNVWIGIDVLSITEKPLDNSYLALLVYLGVGGYLLYSYLIFRGFALGFDFLNQNKYIPFVISMLICGMFENVLVSYFPSNIIFMLLMYKGAYCAKS